MLDSMPFRKDGAQNGHHTFDLGVIKFIKIMQEKIVEKYI